MKNFTVKELMVPLSEYATVNEGATLYEAVLALEKAQVEYDHTKYRHRAVLVLDKGNKVIGKVSHLDVLRAIKILPDDRSSIHMESLRDFGFSTKFIRTQVNERRREKLSLPDLCKIASKVSVDTIMQAPTEGEYVSPDTTLESAIDQMVEENHLSLLVAQDNQIFGILRMSDVFAALFHVMKESQSEMSEDEI